MAATGYIKSLLGGLDLPIRRALHSVVDYAFDTIAFGPPDPDTASVNFSGFFYESTTPSSSNAEFTIAHQLGAAPYLLMPVLPLGSSARETVPLYVTRPADETYIYLRSPSTSAIVRVFVETGGG